MKVLFYGRLAETIGPELEIDAPPAVRSGNFATGSLPSTRRRSSRFAAGGRSACVGDALVRDTYVLGPADRVEFLPPVSGG